jgi:hypothetical protein
MLQKQPPPKVASSSPGFGFGKAAKLLSEYDCPLTHPANNNMAAIYKMVFFMVIVY